MGVGRSLLMAAGLLPRDAAPVTRKVAAGVAWARGVRPREVVRLLFLGSRYDSVEEVEALVSDMLPDEALTVPQLAALSARVADTIELPRAGGMGPLTAEASWPALAPYWTRAQLDAATHAGRAEAARLLYENPLGMVARYVCPGELPRLTWAAFAELVSCRVGEALGGDFMAGVLQMAAAEAAAEEAGEASIPLLRALDSDELRSVRDELWALGGPGVVVPLPRLLSGLAPEAMSRLQQLRPGRIPHYVARDGRVTVPMTVGCRVTVAPAVRRPARGVQAQRQRAAHRKTRARAGP